MKKNDTVKIVVNFVPILLLYLLVTYTPEFVRFSHTILGKAFAVILILFYVKLDMIIGLFVCALVVFYYQTDYVESFNLLKEGFSQDILEDKKQLDDKEKSDNNKTEDNTSDEGFHLLADAYPIESAKKISDVSIDQFRKKHCKKGHLIHKGQTVTPEMSEHVFPEIKQSDYKKCNICDSTCEVEIMTKRMLDESDLTCPKSSNDFFGKVWTNLRTSTEQLLNKE